MNKEEFITRVNTLNWTIRVTEKEKSTLKEKYIADSCPYKVGDKVKIVTPLWKGGEEVEYGFVERIRATDDGDFVPDCAAIKKDGTRHARNKLYVSINAVITKVIDEDDMKLEDYTTEQLREELARRAKIARAEGRKNASNKPTYVSVQGKVVGINGDKLAFARRRWSVQLDKEWASINGVPEVSFYTLLGGVFKKDTAPKVGDLVTLRCRITKMSPKFSRSNARISEIVKNDG